MTTKRRLHTPEQIVRKLSTADRVLAAGCDVAAACRELGVSEQTYYRWRNQYGGLKAEDAKRLKERAWQKYPDVWLLGEVIHGDYPGFVSSTGFGTATQYELWKALWSSLADRNMFELDWALVRHGEFQEAFTPQTFAGNHDVTRIASTVGADGSVVALAILMTVGGIPSIYAGDERGFTAVKEARLGGDDAVRPEFPDAPTVLADVGADVFRAHRQLIALRRARPWLATATHETLALENTVYRYRAAARDRSEYLEVAVDLDGSPAVTISDAGGGVVWSSSQT
jgi:glycosidase